MNEIYKGAGYMIIETTNGITIEYMDRLLLIIVYRQGTLPLTDGDGIKIDNRSGLHGEFIVRNIKYFINKKGLTTVSITDHMGITRQMKIKPRVKGEFGVSVLINRGKGSVTNVKREFKRN